MKNKVFQQICKDFKIKNGTNKNNSLFIIAPDWLPKRNITELDIEVLNIVLKLLKDSQNQSVKITYEYDPQGK